MFIVEFTVISGDPFPETGRLHGDPIKVSNVLTSSIKLFLNLPGLHFKGMYLILYGTVHKNLSKGVDVNNSNTRIFIISQSLCNVLRTLNIQNWLSMP